MSQQINLFNPQLLRQKQYFAVGTMLQGMLLIVLGAALFYAYALYQVQQLTAQSEESTKHYTAALAKLERFSADYSPQQARQLLEDELKKNEARAQAQRELINKLKSGDIGNTMGYSEYMRAFARQAVNGLWLTGFEITGDAVQMRISGAALNPELVPGFIKRMGQEKVMRGKEFATLQMQQHKYDEGKPAGRPYLEFTLQSSDAGGTEK
ncbi:MAG TPA: PilN domain-containing protein [Gallionellaceae bacterium]|nr:PilN domain-containing protein [Gallionellaceae bacterium]